MSRYFFHLSAPDQEVFSDPVGTNVGDLAEAHSRAVRLAERVMTYPAFAGCACDFQRWTVKVADEDQRAVMTVIFPSSFIPTRRKPALDKGARKLLRALDALVNAKRVAILR